MRRKIIGPFFLLFIYSTSFAQKIQQQSLLVDGGISFHGTGDYSGGIGNISYEPNWGSFLSARFQIGTSIHGGSAIGAAFNTGSERRGVPYFTTAGVQTAALMVFHVTGTKYQLLNVMAGPLLRYQISGSPTSYGYTSPSPLHPSGFYTFGEVDPKSFSVGYRVVIESQFIKTKKFDAGFQIGFQNDTEGDTITQLGIVLRRKQRNESK